jgi:hypothetical protein
MLTPRELSAAALSTWLAAGAGAERAERPPIDMDGLRRLPALLDELLAAPARPIDERGGSTPSRRFASTSPATATSSGSVPA